MRRVFLFVLASFLAGLGGALGSMAGHGAGKLGLWIGGLVGGLLGALASVAVARARGWIARDQFGATAAGAMIGFLLAAAVAVHTLSSPIGPILSTSLVGIGALLGARMRPASRAGQRAST